MREAGRMEEREREGRKEGGRGVGRKGVSKGVRREKGRGQKENRIKWCMTTAANFNGYLEKHFACLH